MQLDLTDVLSGPGASVEKPIDIPAGPLDEWELTEPVSGWVRASNARRNIVVRGEADTAVKLQCGRCLCDFSLPMHLSLDVVVPLETFNDLLGAAAVSEEEDDAGDELTKADIAALFQEHSLDVSELVRQGIVLQAPIAPVCSPDCPGLPEATQYRVLDGDPRWAALQQLQQGGSAQHQNNGRSESQDEAGD
jgi:uncharacterized protein